MIRSYFGKLLPLLVLSAGLVATWLLQQAAYTAAHQIQQDNLAYQTREITLHIAQRLTTYEQVLCGTQGLFAVSKRVERNEFRDYVGTCNYLKGVWPINWTARRDYFNFAINGAKRIDQMLMALLEYSRVGRKGEPPTWVESRAVLDEVLLFLQPAIAEAQAKLTMSGDWPRISASHDEIQRLIQNLIGNAVKYRITGRMPEITVESLMVKNEWHLNVAIGLALCRKIAKHHKGRIWAESAGEGLGSKFCVVLPCVGKP